MNPIHGLLRSRKFLVLILDTILSLTLYFVGRYASPDVFDDIKFLIASLQPVFFAVIAGIAWEDGQAKANAWSGPLPESNLNARTAMTADGYLTELQSRPGSLPIVEPDTDIVHVPYSELTDNLIGDTGEVGSPSR